MSLTTYFTGLLCPKKKNLRLQGLAPVNLPPNHLWQQMCTEDNLQTAFDWLCQQTTESSHNSDVWDYRRAWATRKDALRQQLLNGNFQFATVRIVEVENDAGQLERHEVRNAEDKLVIRAMTQVLQPVLPIHPTCTHVKGHGGLKQAVRETQEYLAAHPDSFVMKSDVKGYYAHIDHEVVAEQLHYCLPNEPKITRLVWLFLRRTTEFGGNYVDVQRGLPLAASISPLLGGLYLAPMDALFEQEDGIFYRRYMDDWIIMQNKRHGLRKSVKLVYGVLDALGMQTHPVKKFIGKGNKGFDFLGFAICPTGLTVSDAALSRRDTKIATLFEQGASKRRIGLYLARWLGWATITGATWCGATPCANVSGGTIGQTTDCECFPASSPTRAQCYSYSYNLLDGGRVESQPQNPNTTHCASPADTSCTAIAPITLNDNQTIYLKNTSESADFFKCTFSIGTGFISAASHNPSPPTTTTTSSPVIYRVPVGGLGWGLAAILLSGIGATAWVRRKKRQPL